MIFAGIAVAVQEDDEEDSSASGSVSDAPTVFEGLLTSSCGDSAQLNAIRQNDNAAYYVSVDFPLSVNFTGTCSRSDGIQSAVIDVLPSSPFAVVVAVPVPATVRVTATFPTETTATAAGTALRGFAAVSSISAAIQAQLPGATVNVPAVRAPTTG